MTRCPFEDAIRPEHRADPYPFYAGCRGAPTRLEDGRFVFGAYRDVLALLHDPRMSSIKDDPAQSGSPRRAGRAGRHHRPRPARARPHPPDHDAPVRTAA